MSSNKANFERFKLPEEDPQRFCEPESPAKIKEVHATVNRDTGDSMISIEREDGTKEIRGTIHGYLKKM